MLFNHLNVTWYLHVMFVNTLRGLQFAFLQVEAPPLHLGLVRQWGEPVVETAHDRNVSREEVSTEYIPQLELPEQTLLPQLVVRLLLQLLLGLLHPLLHHLGQRLQLTHRLVNVFPAIDDEVEELLHVGVHGDHAEPDAHGVARGRPLAQTEGGVRGPERGDQLHVPLADQGLLLLREVPDGLGLLVNVFRWNVTNTAQASPVGNVNMLK